MTRVQLTSSSTGGVGAAEKRLTPPKRDIRPATLVVYLISFRLVHRHSRDYKLTNRNMFIPHVSKVIAHTPCHTVQWSLLLPNCHTIGIGNGQFLLRCRVSLEDILSGCRVSVLYFGGGGERTRTFVGPLLMLCVQKTVLDMFL